MTAPLLGCQDTLLLLRNPTFNSLGICVCLCERKRIGEMSKSTDGSNPRKLCGLMEWVQLQWENKESVFVC